MDAKAGGSEQERSETATSTAPLINPKEVPEPAPELSIWDKHPSKINVGILILYLLTGIIVTKEMEGWDLLTSLYVTVQIITTVGYGDITPQTEGAMLFLSFYVFFGIAIVANIVNNVAQAIIDWEEEHVRKELTEFAELHETGEGGILGHTTKEPSLVSKRLQQLAAAVATWLFFVITWTVFLATYESCSCSYGETEVPNCDMKNCTATGGTTKTYIEGFYSGVITLTTVGFGDKTPETKLGRILGMIWMLFGVLATGNLVTSVSNALDASKKANKKATVTSSSIVNSLDLQHPDHINISEFMVFMLLRQHKIKTTELDHIRAVFKAMDKDKKGLITREQIRASFDQQRSDFADEGD